MNPTSNPEYERKCRSKIEAIGLKLVQPTGLYATWNGVDLIDFSAVDPDKYTLHAIKMANKIGFDEGYAQMKDQIKHLLE